MSSTAEPLLVFWTRTYRVQAEAILADSLKQDNDAGRYPSPNTHFKAMGRWLVYVRRPEFELAKQAVDLLLPHLSEEVLDESIGSQREILTSHLNSAAERLGIVAVETLTDSPS